MTKDWKLLLPHNWIIFEKRWIMVLFTVSAAVSAKHHDWDKLCGMALMTICGELLLRSLDLHDNDDNDVDPTGAA